MTEEMVQRYAAEERNKVFDLIGDKELAKKVADYRSNLILYAYRLGASEGQSGMAMSNRDFAILMESQSGKSAPTVAARIKRELTQKSKQLDSDIRNYNANSRVSKYIRNSGIDPTIKSKVASRYEYKRNSGLLNFAKATQDANNSATNKLLDQIIKKSGIKPESKNFIFEMVKEASTQIKSNISSEKDKQEYMDRIIEEKLAKEFGMSREDSLRLFKSFNTLTNN
jgi:AraC-like DNA-binding protein